MKLMSEELIIRNYFFILKLIISIETDNVIIKQGSIKII